MIPWHLYEQGEDGWLRYRPIRVRITVDVSGAVAAFEAAAEALVPPKEPRG